MEEWREGGDGGAGSGAGGKMTRRSFRTRAPSTPYDRPPLARKSDSGWFSKLLLRPASKILPSLFTGRSQDPNPLPLPPLSEPQPFSEPEREDRNVEPTLIPDEPGAPARTGHQEADSKGNELVGDKSGNIRDDNGLANIEQQLKQKKFSTDETNRLIELLRSRTIDLPEDDGHTARFTPEAPETIPGQKNFRTAKEEYPVYKTSKTGDPFPFTVQDVGSSPIEIAKAYMGGQTPSSGYDCQSGRLKNGSVFSSEKSILKLPSTSAAKSSICRPGAMVQNDHGYFTPQRGRTGFGPRTPYHGAIFSNSKFQVGERAESSSAVWKQSLTPMFGSTKKSSRRTNTNLDNTFASGSPIRHVRPKNMMTTASTGATPSSQANAFPFLSKSSDPSIAGGNPEPTSSKRGFYNVQSIDVDDEASEFPSDSLTVHPQASKMAKKILEHLNRTVPSPKEKSSELKLAIERTRSPPNSSNLVKDGHDDRTVIRNSAEQKTSCLLGRDVVPQEGANAKKVLLGPSTSISNDKDGLLSPLQTNNQASFRQFQKTTYTEEASHSSHETPIAASKHGSKLNTCDNGINFSFPVTFSSNALYEPPPTPTLTSSVAASKKLEASRENIPSFKIGSSTSDSRLVFSFGSTSNPPDTTTPVFKFGTENKPALSFKPIGKDSFCC